ncbi:MAG: hypothetical protein SWK76_07190 [Actinomycetota bacterium]|nr:hypothetical protein [Actinomycetota bacterium]
MSFYKPFLRVCRECGVPLRISRDHIWEEYGRILSHDTSQRLVIVERKVLDEVFGRALKKIGGGLENSLRNAKAFDASHYVRSVMVGWRKLALGYPMFKKPYYKLLCDRARLLGLADADLVSYKRGKEVIISCTSCYNKVFFSGDVLGAVYAGEGKGASVQVEEKGDETLFPATVREGDADEIKRYSFSWEVPLPGYISYKRCETCGIPFPVSFFIWDMEKGLMVDTHNGEPVSLVDVAGMNAAYEEIRAEQGKWVDDFLAQETKDRVDTILPGLEWKRRRPEEKIRDLFFLAYRGMGNPIFTEPMEGGIKARIENPFNYPMVAGISASFLARGMPVAFEWERVMPGRLEVRLHFL